MTDNTDALQTTPLHDLHLEAGARMVPFAGYSMPVQYPLGVKQEHLHTRSAAGLFDVSHMGQMMLHGEHAAAELEKLVPVDILDLPVGKQRYAIFTDENGGILDDLMVTRYESCLYLVVNAACKEADIAHLQAHLGRGVKLERLDDRALVALQGPKAAEVLARLNPAVADMVFMDNRRLTLDGASCFVSRSGYTGEDGYEISIPQADAKRLARRLLAEPEVEWIGLGARDSLRLESGLCLYGHDIDETTTPLEGSLIWAISKVRRTDGERPGGFLGSAVIMAQIAHRNWTRKRIGLVGVGRAPVREGTELFNALGDRIGVVTSGTFGPSAGKSIAMGYVETAYSGADTEVFADVRGKKLAMTVSPLPFVEQRYYRG